MMYEMSMMMMMMTIGLVIYTFVGNKRVVSTRGYVFNFLSRYGNFSVYICMLRKYGLLVLGRGIGGGGARTESNTTI